MKYLSFTFAGMLSLIAGCFYNESAVSNAPDDLGTLVDIPAGEFQMGCNEAVDDWCLDNEKPYHSVTLSAYKISKYEVTAGEYQRCVDVGSCKNDGEHPHYGSNADKASCNLDAEGKEGHPMNCVSWYGAKAYCEWMGGRLPTEAEWEKAARGTDGRKYPWGNEPRPDCDYVVMGKYNEETRDYDLGCGADGTMPVGSKKKGKSPYGVHDMIGNVSEWVNDWYANDYYTSSPTTDPAGPESGVIRMLRGGSWLEHIDFYLRASYRDNAQFSPDTIATHYGFRCAK